MFNIRGEKQFQKLFWVVIQQIFRTFSNLKYLKKFKTNGKMAEWRIKTKIQIQKLQCLEAIFRVKINNF